MSHNDIATTPPRPARRPPVVGVDARAANSERRAGIGTYCCELLRAMAPLCREGTLRVYLDRAPVPSFPLNAHQADFRVLPSKWAWTQRALRTELLKDPPDVLLAPSMQIPLGVKCPLVVTVLDLASFDFGAYFTWKKRLRSRLQARHATRRADHLISISESTHGDLIRILGVSGDRITVIPLAASAAFDASEDEDKVSGMRDSLRLPERYILYVGRLQPRKNIGRLIKAYELLRTEHPELPHHLVIAGDKGWMYDTVLQVVRESPHSAQIHVLGFVAEEALPSLMRGADVFALVSLWEGFGIPVIEAMACGTAVVASNCSSLPEVAGDAAVLVDPYSVESIAAGLAAVLTQDKFRADLEARGRERARKFSWQTTAERTLEVLLRLAEASATRSRR